MTKAVDLVWGQGFYRKNYLFFLFFIGLFAFIVKPPYLLFSPYLLEPMLASPAFLGGVMGALLLYYIKGLRDSIAIIHEAKHAFLYQLICLERKELFLVVGKQLWTIFAPVWLYTLYLAGYSIYLRGLQWIPLGIGCILSIWLAFGLTLFHLKNPREYAITQNWQTWLEKQFQRSLSYLSLMSTWHHYARLVLLIKGISWILVFAIGLQNGWVLKAIYLCLWAITALQGILYYRLRQAEEKEQFILRNLPIPRSERWLNYLLSCMVIGLGDGWIWILSGGTFIIGGEILLAHIGVGLLAVAMLHYRPMELSTYLNYVIGLFMVGFMLMLFGLPLGIWGIGCILFSYWIFWEEYYKWNGWQKE
ncbi:MAG: hypothetical protein AAFY71_10930 [Bacteroidota bacterium]